MTNIVITGLVMMVCLAIPIVHFERRKVNAEEIVVIALMSAVAAVARVPFASLPSVQPTSFIIIITAYTLGAETGLIVGTLAALISNMFLGQGPWTPWQMFCWGMMGLSSGLLRNTWVMKNKFLRLAFGFGWGYLFGWIMNLWFVVQFEQGVSIKVYLLACVSSFYFDLNHALSNIFFMLVFFKSWERILRRTKIKYMS